MASLSKPSQPTTAKALHNAADVAHHGAIVTWRNVKNGAEYSTHEEGHLAAAVLGSIARLVARGLDLRQWRCQCVSTPQRIFSEVSRGPRSKYAKPDAFEGKMALTILSHAGR